MDIGVVFTLLLVLGAEFLNGWTDAPNATAAAVATGLLTKKAAMWLAVILNAAGTLSALVFGAAVAHTIGKGIVSSDSVTLASISAAMLAIILWGLAATYFGLPVSKSHALFAGLAGAAFQAGGIHALLVSGWITILKGVGISTIVVFSIAWALSGLLLYAGAKNVPDRTWRRLQAGTVMLVAFGHGWNDGLKFVGVFALVLLLGGVTSTFTIYPWIVILCAIVMGLGTMCGGWRIVARIAKEMVNDVYHPSQGGRCRINCGAWHRGDRFPRYPNVNDSYHSLKRCWRESIAWVYVGKLENRAPHRAGMDCDHHRLQRVCVLPLVSARTPFIAFFLCTSSTRGWFWRDCANALGNARM